MAKQAKQSKLCGLITDKHLDQAEREFPGIRAFYAGCKCKPHTFLELAWRFQCECDKRRAA